jgi:hypothetical protein
VLKKVAPAPPISETVRGLERPAGYALCKATKTERKEIFATSHDMYHHDAGTYPADT